MEMRQKPAGRDYNKSDQKTFEWIGHYSLDIKQHSFKLMGGYSYNYFNYSGVSTMTRIFHQMY